MRRVFAAAVLAWVGAPVHACLFARDTQPAQWFEWATALFAADVVSVDQDRQKSLDLISVRVTETFKGPEGAAAATLEVPSRMWASCKLERPLAGAHVLVALNPNNDTLVVALSAAYSEQLRRYRASKAPR